MGLPAFEADYLFMAPLIEARLKAQVPDIPCDVCETADQVLQADNRAQVLMVLWAGDIVPAGDAGNARQGSSQFIHQRWLVVLGINNAGKAKDARLVVAGRWLSQVHKALAGWSPMEGARPLRRVTSPLRPTFTTTKAVYPLGFEVPLTL